MFSERSGVINLALEGIMLFGAFSGCLFVYLFTGSFGNVQLLLIAGMVVAALGGIIYSLLLSYAAINMKADQTITGTAMNMLIPALVLLICKMTFNSDGITTNANFYIREVPVLSNIPVIGELFFKNTYLTVYIGFALMIIVTILYHK